jgi:hypothetical protein
MAYMQQDTRIRAATAVVQLGVPDVVGGVMVHPGEVMMQQAVPAKMEVSTFIFLISLHCHTTDIKCVAIA